MSKPEQSRVFRFADADRGIPGPADEHAIRVLQRGRLDLKLSRPVPPNRQTPHAQDEIYVVVRGRGILVHGDRRERMEAGDCAFVAAGTEHRFEEFSEDLAVWVIFYGPPGGERAAGS